MLSMEALLFLRGNLVESFHQTPTGLRFPSRFRFF